MKKIAFLLAFVCALAVSGYAQTTCTVTGTIYKPAATSAGLLPCANCTFRIVRTIKNGVVVSTSPVPVVSNASGVVSFVVVDSSQIRIQGEVYGYQQGTDVNIPAAASCPITLESLTTATPVVSTGLTLKTNNTALSANKQGTLDFSSRFALTESPSAETNIELAASGVTAGTCTNCNLTIDAYGRVTAKANGSGGSGSGLLTLNGLTADPQTFSRTNDTNLNLTITSATDDHNFALSWAGTLAVARGGTRVAGLFHVHAIRRHQLDCLWLPVPAGNIQRTILHECAGRRRANRQLPNARRIRQRELSRGDVSPDVWQTERGQAIRICGHCGICNGRRRASIERSLSRRAVVRWAIGG